MKFKKAALVLLALLVILGCIGVLASCIDDDAPDTEWDNGFESGSEGESETESFLEDTYQKYSINYQLNGGINSSSNPSQYSSGKGFTLSAPTKKGYTFIGWTYYGQTTPLLNITMPAGTTGNKTYFANWEANSYTVTLNPNGGSCEPSTITVTYGSSYTLPVPTYSDIAYGFEGWYNGNTQYTDGTWSVDNDVTLTARWELITADPDDYEYEVTLNGVVIKKYIATSSVAIVPETIDDIPVIAIAEGAFSGCSGLTSVTIGNGVESIGSYAFRGCSRLTSITIPDSVTSIGDYAFYNCSGLTSVTIPDSVTSIGSYAFYNCSGLTSITIPDSVTGIGYDAFSGCSGLTSITIGNGVESIGNYVFYGCSGLTSITIPDGVTSIGKQAFDGCSGLTSVTIGNGVTSIGSSAFYDCSGLESITIPFVGEKADGTGKTHFGYIFGASSYSSNDDYVPTSLKTVVITGGSIIGSSAFSGCSGLTNITIPDSVTSIGEDAFYKCSGLTSITVDSGNSVYESKGNCLIEKSTKTLIVGCKNSQIPTDGSVTGIGYRAFYGCRGLTSITIPDSVKSIGDDAFFNCSGLTSITIPDSITSIGDHAFVNCSGLTSITIPDSVTSIGSSAFYGCSGLVYNEYDNAYYLGNDTNKYLVLIKAKNTDITSCSIHQSTEFIYDSAFRDCSGLTSITIPDIVTSIGDYAFAYCIGLTSVTIGNGVESIGDWVFDSCSGLTSITIPNSVKRIGYRAFSDCRGLTSITIPDSVTSIGSWAFYNCSRLTTINYTGTEEQWKAISKSSAQIPYGVTINYNYVSET